MNHEAMKISSTHEETMSHSQQDCVQFAGLKSAEFDPCTLWDRVDRDVQLLRYLVGVFIKQGPELLLQMEQAIAQGAPSTLRQVSHKMKGSALQFAAPSAAALAGTLEEMGERGSLAGAAETLVKLRSEITSLMEKLNLMVTAAGRG